MAWNDLMLTEHAQKSNQIKYEIYANNQCNGQPLTKQQRLAVAHLNLNKTNHLPHKVEIVKGMKAMVLMNISTESDLANGTRGVIEDIILGPKEGRACIIVDNPLAISTSCDIVQTIFLSESCLYRSHTWDCPDIPYLQTF
jgi:hypothetical protein